MTQPSSPSLKDRFPARYSFITVRREKGGGLLYNPYLYRERWIDEYGFFIIASMNGRLSFQNIIQSLAREYHLDLYEAEKIAHATVKDLEKYYAINWKPGPVTGSIQPEVTLGPTTRPDGFSAPLSVIWDVTYRCNLICRHCLIEKTASVREMDTDEAFKVIDELKKMKVFTIIFSGGEPLIRDDLFTLIKYAADRHMGVYLNSNGLLLTAKNLETLSDLGVSCLQISLDGLEKTHDTFRGKKGAFKKTCDAFKRASAAGFYTIMSTTLTLQNMDEIPCLMEKAVSFHASSFKINGFVPAGRGKANAGDIAIPRERYQEFTRTMLGLKEEYKDILDIQIDALYPWLLQSKTSSVHIVRGYRASPLIRCSAGHSNLVVAPDGTVFACPYLTAFPLGNILKTPLYAIWNNQNTILSRFRNMHQDNLSGACKTCSYIPESCNGGCRALAYQVMGDLYAEDPSCWMKKTT